MHYAVRRFAREYSLEGFCFVFIMEENSVLVNRRADLLCCRQEAGWLNLRLLRERWKALPAWFNDAEWKRITVTLDWNLSVPTWVTHPPCSKGQNNQVIFLFLGWSSLINELLTAKGAIITAEKKKNLYSYGKSVVLVYYNSAVTGDLSISNSLLTEQYAPKHWQRGFNVSKITHRHFWMVRE